MKIKYNYETISGAVFAIVAAVLWFLIPTQIQTMETSSINAQTFPRIAISGMFLCSAGLFLQGVFTKPMQEVLVNSAYLRSEAFRKKMRSLIYAAMLLIYAIIITYVGFVIATILLVIGILLFYGARKWWYYAIPMATVGIVYYVFGVLLRVSLP